jgi:sugar lactone lactonase YvrE
VAVFSSDAPAAKDERACAWYGDERGGVLYFGEAAFWSSMRAAGGDPTADLRVPNPQRIGRFDLSSRRMLPPLDVSAPGGTGASGVWDVLAHPNGRVYFTTYFETSGWVDPATGRTQRLDALGVGLNELTTGPDGSVLASRYGTPGQGGSIVRFDPDGRLLSETPLDARPGVVVAPKTVAYDPVSELVWVTTDLVSTDGRSLGHDTRVVDRHGQSLVAVSGDETEVQFVRFADDGTGYFAERRGARLVLRVTTPARGGAPAALREWVLDEAFATALDFAQDVHVAADGRVVVARWSGEIDVVSPDLPDARAVHRVRLPRLADDGLYYTAVIAGDDVCSTLCADVQVVCAALPQ